VDHLFRSTIYAPMTPLIVINNAAAKARSAWPSVRNLLESAGLAYESYETSGPGDATVRTRAALRAGVETIAVVGGDGTLSEAAEGFFEFKQNVSETPSQINPSAALATLPAGTGDDFARGLTHGNRAGLEHWTKIFISHCQALSNDHTRIIDVLYGACNDFRTPFICLNASTMGIGGETAARVAAQGKLMQGLSGEARFAAAAFVSIARWRERRVRV
jgi:diacylglycerol kinase family enzyme